MPCPQSRRLSFNPRGTYYQVSTGEDARPCGECVKEAFSPERKIEAKIRLYMANFESRRRRFARSKCLRLPQFEEVDSDECSTVVIKIGTPLASFARTFVASPFAKKLAELQALLYSEAPGEEDDPEQLGGDNPAIDHEDGALKSDTDATRLKISWRDIFSGSTKSNKDRGGKRCL